MTIKGYKGFNQNFTNRYGAKFEIGQTYHANGEIKWRENGFHLCTNIEDCFRYVDPNVSIITEVIGFGKAVLYEDEYYGYYDMYAVENLYIKRIVERDEIINMLLNTYEERQERFINTFNLTEKEKKLFKGVK